MRSFSAPAWLPGGHAQTIWPALLARRALQGAVQYRRERVTTPDGDFIDIDFALDNAPPDAPTLVLFHGLEGSSQSHYALAFGQVAAARGWRFVVPHFRGCSGPLNDGPRAYHSGDFEEIGWILEWLMDHRAAPLFVAGISLGGNALMRWAAESGRAAGATVRAVASICSPLDLTEAGRAIDRGFNRWAYARMFLQTMKPRALAKWAQHPGLFDRERVAAARTLYEFDDAFTAPLHGFAGTDDYWARASAKPHLHRIRIPALALNARNDPFVPARSLPQADAGITLWQPRHGGHVGFPAGPFPGHVMTMPQAVVHWLAEQA